MNTHTLIIKCNGSSMPASGEVGKFVENELEKPSIEYFGRNGKRLYSNPKGITESLEGKFFVIITFGHLLNLDAIHAVGVIRAALQMNLSRTIRRETDGIDIIFS